MQVCFCVSGVWLGVTAGNQAGTDLVSWGRGGSDWAQLEEGKKTRRHSQNTVPHSESEKAAFLQGHSNTVEPNLQQNIEDTAAAAADDGVCENYNRSPTDSGWILLTELVAAVSVTNNQTSADV